MVSNVGDNVDMLKTEETRTSEPTVEIKIKTLDSQTYTLRVDKCVSHFVRLIISYANVKIVVQETFTVTRWLFIFVELSVVIYCRVFTIIHSLYVYGRTLIVLQSIFTVNQPRKYFVT